jgi:hypothetical protein
MDEHRVKGATEGLGAGSEASEGMHDARGEGERREDDKTGLSGQETGRSTREGGGRAGSEPLTEEGEHQHRSGYGGAGGKPVTSSDERDGPRRP